MILLILILFMTIVAILCCLCMFRGDKGLRRHDDGYDPFQGNRPSQRSRTKR